MLAFALAATANGEDIPDWKAILVRFTIRPEGDLHVREQIDLDASAATFVIAREYPFDPDQPMHFESISKVTDLETNASVKLERGALDKANHFDTPYASKIAWSVRDKGAAADSTEKLRYIIEYNVDNAIIPAWGIPRGTRSFDGNIRPVDPRIRLRELIPIWREALQKPRSRYLLQYTWESTPPGNTSVAINRELYWPDDWSPVHEITRDTIDKIFPDKERPDRLVLRHLFDYSGAGTPPRIPLRETEIQMASLIGFPIAGLLLWLFFFVREMLRRPRGGSEEVDDRVLRETVFNEPPEVIAARWRGSASSPSIETFLRRLEKQRKIAITITPSAEADGDPLISLRLLAQRDQLTPYERAGIDALIPEGWDTTSEQIAKRHHNEDFDPTDALDGALAQVVKESGGPTKTPVLSQFTSFAIFAFGLFLIGSDFVNSHREPVFFFGTLVICSILMNMWPGSFARAMILMSLGWTALLLIPVILGSAILAAAHLSFEIPPGYRASIGIALALLGTIKSMLASSATREPRESLGRRAELARARAWMKNEMRSQHPRIQPDQIAYVDALGLRWKGTRPTATDEAWGASFMTWQEE